MTGPNLTRIHVGFRSILNQRHEHLLKQITKDHSKAYGQNPYGIEQLVFREECKGKFQNYKSSRRPTDSNRSASCAATAPFRQVKARTQEVDFRATAASSRSDTRERFETEHKLIHSPTNSETELVKIAHVGEAEVVDRHIASPKSVVTSSETVEANHRPKLGKVMKDVNERFIKSLETQYSESNKKYSPLAIQLADVYIKGKRVPQNLFRAVEILSASALAEAKFMLVKLAYDNQSYSDAFHYLEFFSLSKCT